MAELDNSVVLNARSRRESNYSTKTVSLNKSLLQSTSDEPEPVPFHYSRKEFWLVILGICHMLPSAGVCWGWNALQGVLTAQDPELSARNLDAIFVWGFTGNYLSNIPFGTM
jgi:hypothetical protein